MLQIAPSGYGRSAAAQRNPALRSERSEREDTSAPQVQRVWHANMLAYSADKLPVQIGLVKAGIESSVSSVGDAYDNALAETITDLD